MIQIESPWGRTLAVGDGRTRLMGVLNLTPDSFSDGGRFADAERAVAHALAMVDAGAAVIDLGGESTRPGHAPVPALVQIERVLPVLSALRSRTAVPISIDTTSAEVAATALGAGADWINDTSALAADPGMAEVVAERGCPVVLMHRFAPPRAPGADPAPGRALVRGIGERLAARLAAALAHGIAAERILLDPGVGFGTLPADNVAICAHVGELRRLGRPLVCGPSRKSFLGVVTGRAVGERAFATAASVAALALAGVELVRVHDVGAMRDVAVVADAIRAAAEA